MSIGAKSRVDVIRERYGLSRDQAIDRLKQVKEDEDAADAIMPPEPPPVEVNPDGKEPETPVGDDQTQTNAQDPEAEETDGDE